MSDVKEKKISNVFTDPDVKNVLKKGKEEISQKPNEILENVKDFTKAKRANTEKTTKKEERHTVFHTQADVNWATLANKVTVPNVTKAGLTIGGGYAGSVLGVVLCTGLGMAVGGPAVATVGYYIGNVVGFGAGAVGGHRFGKVVAQELEDGKKEEFVKSGTTQVNDDIKIDVEKE
jgi:hypothetical protein